MKRPCACEKARKGEPYTSDQCRLCWNYWNDAAYHRLWNGKDTEEEPKPLSAVTNTMRERLARWRLLRAGGRCQHDLGPTGEMRRCNTCGGQKDVALYGCALHGRCTHLQPLPREAVLCSTCGDFESADKETTEAAPSTVPTIAFSSCSFCASHPGVRCTQGRCELAPRGHAYDVRWMCRLCWKRIHR